MKNQERVILQEKAELILQEKVIRIKKGFAFMSYVIVKNTYCNNNIGQGMHSTKINQMLSDYPSDLRYMIVDEDDNILFKNFKYTTLEKRIKELEKTVDKLKNELYKENEGRTKLYKNNDGKTIIFYK